MFVVIRVQPWCAIGIESGAWCRLIDSTVQLFSLLEGFVVFVNNGFFPWCTTYVGVELSVVCHPT